MLEAAHDFGYVQISTDEGNTWTTLWSTTGIENAWNWERIDLSDYSGANIILRFRLVTDGEGQADGWYIDDVSISDGMIMADYPFFDDVEGGSLEPWFNNSPWGQTTEDAHSGATCWTDSPGASYANSSDTSLRMSINLGLAVMPVLNFWQRHALEKNTDFAYVEVSTDGGTSWDRIYFVTGSSADWVEEKVDLTEYAGKAEVMIRFRLVTDASGQAGGWYIDDVSIAETATPSLPYPFFDDVESAGNWLTGSWRNVTPGHSPFHCLTDSPVGNYLKNTNARMRLILAGTIDLSGAVHPMLSFWHKHNFYYKDYAHEDENDYGRVYVSTYYGQSQTWETVATYYDQQSDWVHQQIDLSPYAGQSEVRIMFAVVDDYGRYSSTYYYHQSDGWHIDDVMIADEGTELVKRIVISPDTASILEGNTLQFQVTGYDVDDNEVPVGGIVLSVRGDIGTIDEDGLFTATKTGVGAIVATFNETIKDITGIIEVVGSGGGTPQNEQGNLFNSDSGVPADGCIYFNAFIADRPEEILTQASPGCGYTSGVWQVNVGNFPGGWNAGETLHIDFMDKCKGEKGALDYVLTDGSQQNDLTLSPFSFDLITTATTNVNVVTLLKDSGITNAEDLAQEIPNTLEVAYWDAQYQAYVGHTKGSPLTNFPVYPGYPYFVTVTDPGSWTPTGTVPDPWPFFDLILTGKTNVNMIGIPLSTLRVTNAEELGHMILDCTEIARWDTEDQGYEAHTYKAPLFNFAVSPALPYFVTVTSESQWGMEALGSGEYSAAGTTQNEGGHVYNSDMTVPGDGEIEFSAYIVGRGDETLTETSPGCGYVSGYWQVNVGNFPTAWDAGDVLHVEFTNTSNGEIGSLEVTLEYGGHVNDVTLSPPPCQGNFDGDQDVDGSDLAVFSVDFGRTDCDGDCRGDFDSDGDVDGSDLAVFSADFGRTDCP